jgi:hypothetical protein
LGGQKKEKEEKLPRKQRRRDLLTGVACESQRVKDFHWFVRLNQMYTAFYYFFMLYNKKGRGGGEGGVWIPG